MFCTNCGKEIDDKAFVCPHCGVKQKCGSEDGPVGGLGVVCFLFPLVGLILYLTWKKDKPLKAAGAGKAALWGFIAGIVLSVIIVGIAMAVGISMFNAQATNSNRQAIVGDMNNLASTALGYYKTPTKYGGGGNAWSSNVDNVGNWLGYGYITSTNTLTTKNGSFYLSINRDILTIVGTGIEIGNDGTSNVAATMTVNGVTRAVVTTIIN